MNYTILAYSIYLPTAIVLTIWVANKLLNNAKVFYVDIFQGQNEQALSLNKLLQVGFYLTGLGFAFLRLEITPLWESNNNGISQYNYLNTVQELIEVLSIKVGGFVVILGIMLFVNLITVLKLRSGSTRTQDHFVKNRSIEI